MIILLPINRLIGNGITVVQISKKRLDKDIELEMFRQFWNSLSRISDPELASQFFSDLLTDTEKIMLAKRFTASILLIRGRSATDIKNTIHITYSTVGSVASWVKNAKPKTKKILLSLSGEKEWERIIDKIESVLDKLPPMYGTDWSQSGKEKWLQIKKRAAKKSLR